MKTKKKLTIEIIKLIIEIVILIYILYNTVYFIQTDELTYGVKAILFMLFSGFGKYNK